MIKCEAHIACFAKRPGFAKWLDFPRFLAITNAPQRLQVWRRRLHAYAFACFGGASHAPCVLLLALTLFVSVSKAQSIYSQAYTFTTLAGFSGTGSADGVGTDAQFHMPTGAAVDTAGNLYVADSKITTPFAW